jgi:hypothetical protein
MIKLGKDGKYYREGLPQVALAALGISPEDDGAYGRLAKRSRTEAEGEITFDSDIEWALNEITALRSRLQAAERATAAQKQLLTARAEHFRRSRNRMRSLLQSILDDGLTLRRRNLAAEAIKLSRKRVAL